MIIYNCHSTVGESVSLIGVTDQVCGMYTCIASSFNDTNSARNIKHFVLNDFSLLYLLPFSVE